MDINEIFYNLFWITLYIVILIAFVIWIITFAINKKREKNEKKHAYEVTFLHIKLPPDNEIEVKAAEHMFANLTGFSKNFWGRLFSGDYRISFEIVSKADGIGFYVVVPDEIAVLVEKQINAAYPSAEIDIVNPHEIWDRGEYTEVAELKLRNAAFYPIKQFEESKSDTLNFITSAMSKLADDEVVTIQYVLQPATDNWRYMGQKYVGSLKYKASDSEKKVHIDTSVLEPIEKKISQPGFYTKIRIVAVAKDRLSAQNHVQNLVSAFEQFNDVRQNRFVRASGWSNWKQKVIDNFIYRKISVKDWYIPVMGFKLYSNASILNLTELSQVFHFPNKNVETPNIIWLTARKSQAPSNLPTSGLYLGKSVYRGVEKKVYMKEKDRTRHFYIIGQTGTGKSQMMMSLAVQDIQNGEGLAIIDPHGSDIDELLEKIPPEREDDVILFDVSDTERPMGINMLDVETEEEKHMTINAFIALLYKLYDPNRQGIMGPQLERSIRNVMLTAMVEKGSTMVDVLRLLIDVNYSKKFIDKLEDPLVKRFWTDEIAKTSDFHKSEKMGYMVSKFDRFVTDKLIRNIVGQPKSAINLNEIMSQKKILLVDLAKGKIGEENSTFLGLLLVPKILSAALGRHKFLGKEDFPNFFLYVDEFQNFATPDFATILSEARKYKLNLTVAHQFVSQLQEDIKNAIFGNVGTMTVFRVGTDDAEYLETYFQPKFQQSDLSNLPIGNCYVKLLVDGHPTTPFSMAVDWNAITSTPRNKDVAERIRLKSRQKYGVPVEEVEEYISIRAGFNQQENMQLPNTEDNRKLPF